MSKATMPVETPNPNQRGTNPPSVVLICDPSDSSPLDQVIVIETGTVVSGTINLDAGTATVDLPSGKYTTLANQLAGPNQVTVTLTYNSSNQVTGFTSKTGTPANLKLAALNTKMEQLHAKVPEDLTARLDDIRVMLQSLGARPSSVPPSGDGVSKPDEQPGEGPH